MKKLAADLGEDLDHEASQQIRTRTYVDDGAGGGTREQVERFRGQRTNGEYDGTLARILKLVNLQLKGIVASRDSDPEVLALMGEKVLGHTWRLTEDKFVFKIQVNISAKKRGTKLEEDFTLGHIDRLPALKLTKRNLLGVVMCQFDSMGVMCPLIIILKIELRKLFGPEVDLGWDDDISSDLHQNWVRILTMLIAMGEIVIDRVVRPSGAEDVPEIIGFADGSLSPYGCAFYVRWKLLEKKSRVTPVRGITAPRSEVSGFLILSRLLKVVINAMEVKPSRVAVAVNSQCTISAVEKSGGLLAPYFVSRISEAMENLSEVAEDAIVNPIKHVPGKSNPADIPTRATTTPEEVRQGSIWQDGPEYLSQPRDSWPFSRVFLDVLPNHELRAPRAVFNLMVSGEWRSPLGKKLTEMIFQEMESLTATRRLFMSQVGTWHKRYVGSALSVNC